MCRGGSHPTLQVHGKILRQSATSCTGAEPQEPGCLQWVCLSLLSFGFPAAVERGGGGACSTGWEVAGCARQEVEVAENALVSGACVGLGASVLTWDCATHLPNGFTLCEDEGTLPHAAPISPSEWSSFPNHCSSQVPGTLNNSRSLHTPWARSALLRSLLNPLQTRRGVPLNSLPQKPQARPTEPCYQNLLSAQ